MLSDYYDDTYNAGITKTRIRRRTKFIFYGKMLGLLVIHSPVATVSSTAISNGNTHFHLLFFLHRLSFRWYFQWNRLLCFDGLHGKDREKLWKHENNAYIKWRFISNNQGNHCQWQPEVIAINPINNYQHYYMRLFAYKHKDNIQFYIIFAFNLKMK